LNNWFKFHFPFLLWLTIIFVQSSFPALELPEIKIISADKLAHIGVYGLLAALCYVSLIHQDKVRFLQNNPLLLTFLICTLYGASDEIHQYFVPNRDAEVYDWAADVTGVIIMVFLIKFYFEKKLQLFKRAAIN
jgi:VanZ family protein